MGGGEKRETGREIHEEKEGDRERERSMAKGASCRETGWRMTKSGLE